MFSSIYRLEEKTVALAIAYIDKKLSHLFPYLPASHLLIWRMRRNVLFILLVIGLTNTIHGSTEEKIGNTEQATHKAAAVKDPNQDESKFKCSG